MRFWEKAARNLAAVVNKIGKFLFSAEDSLLRFPTPTKILLYKHTITS
jgi:hypothetical protein